MFSKLFEAMPYDGIIRKNSHCFARIGGFMGYKAKVGGYG